MGTQSKVNTIQEFPMSVEEDDEDCGLNPRGELETICRRDARFNWPEFSSEAVGPSHKQLWQCKGTIEVKTVSGSRKISSVGSHVKKSRAIGLGE